MLHFRRLLAALAAAVLPACTGLCESVAEAGGGQGSFTFDDSQVSGSKLRGALSRAVHKWTALFLCHRGGTRRPAAGLAPGLTPTVARAVTATFVFLQSVHYAVWTVGFGLVACFHLRQAVSWYMTVAKAHVWFELAVFAYCVGRRSSAARTA